MAVSALELSEEEWLAQVLGLAYWTHWRRAHFRPGRTAHGWRTPVQADGAGFPDLILCRAPRLIAAELKRDAKTERARAAQLTNAQHEWLLILEACGAEAYVWRPADFEQVRELLA